MNMKLKDLVISIDEYSPAWRTKVKTRVNRFGFDLIKKILKYTARFHLSVLVKFYIFPHVFIKYFEEPLYECRMVHSH